MSDRKYTVQEIDWMRKSVEQILTVFNVSYNGAQRAIEIEQRLRTYMANGTEPCDLASAAEDQRRKQFLSVIRQQESESAYRRSLPPPPPPPKTADEVLERWFSECVAKYPGASTVAKELYDGFSGRTLMRFANECAPDGVHISQRDMERFLDANGVRSRRAMFNHTYDGIRHVLYGNVISGGYST